MIMVVLFVRIYIRLDETQKYHLVAYDDNNDVEAIRHDIIMDIVFANDLRYLEYAYF